ncbi:MAG: proton-conducting transporter membrane subunit [Vicinamibacterales bacterium]
MTMFGTVIAGGFTIGAAAAALMPTGRSARQASLAGTFVACVGAGAAAGRALVTHSSSAATWPTLLRPLGGVSLTLDPLAAWFLLIVAFVGASAALYAFGYMRYLDAQPRGRLLHGCLALFVGAMAAVVLADNVLTFLVSWELMALSSYVLVVAGSADDDAAAAGMWYAVMTHAGFLALLVAFLILSHGGSLEFSALRAQAIALPPSAATSVFLLVALACGSKAGLVPLHVWLPRAHPAAPSHVSALMSAAMVSLGVYGVLRICFDLLPVGPAWWGGLFVAVGVVTALTGVLYMVAETHLKRLLAYSTIENAGIIFIGVGFALLMRGYGYPTLAALGLTAALLHTLNHAVFKSLLFLCAGAVVQATHASSLEAYGGLIKRMPQTAALCLIGALALAALPPLNGFPSEWLTFQLLVAGARSTAPTLAILLPLALAGVVLVAGLAAVSAVRLFGITFLAMPRTAAAAAAREAQPLMRLAMVLPAIGCVLLGLWPTTAVRTLGVVTASVGLPPAPLEAGVALGVPLNASHLFPAGLAAVLVAVGLLVFVVVRRRVDRQPARLGPAWNCGRVVHSPRAEYTAAAFAEPLKRVFTGFYQPRQEVTIDVHPVSRYFVRSIAFRTDLAPWMEELLYQPLIHAARWMSLQTRRLQTGSIHLYLALLPAALLALLLLAQWMR